LTVQVSALIPVHQIAFGQIVHQDNLYHQL
jgi:hypothetical protein